MAVKPLLTSSPAVLCCPQVPPSCGPSAAHPGCERPRRTKHPDLGQPIAAPLERCAELLGVDLATIREAAANVEPYVRADGTRICGGSVPRRIQAALRSATAKAATAITLSSSGQHFGHG